MKRLCVSLIAGLFLLPVVFEAAGAPPNYARELGNSFADAVERVMPSVVVIRSESTVYHAARDIYFGGVYGIPERLAGQGSGVIISKDGYVIYDDCTLAPARDASGATNTPVWEP